MSCRSSQLVLNTIPFGIGVAASTRVGNRLGARSASGARHAAHASALLSVITGFTVLVVLMATKNVSLVLCIHELCADKYIGLRTPLHRRHRSHPARE
jgi:Na+-driven multidrug efflux pump